MIATPPVSSRQLFVLWVVGLLVINLLWEIMHFPLYGVAQRFLDSGTLYSIVHCTLGDGLIAAGSFLLAAAICRDGRWLLQQPLRGGATAMLAGLAYTIASEWYHVHVVGTWYYTAAMPTIFGIGLSPIMQWFVPPPLWVWGIYALVRRHAVRGLKLQ